MTFIGREAFLLCNSSTCTGLSPSFDNLSVTPLISQSARSQAVVIPNTCFMCYGQDDLKRKVAGGIYLRYIW